jgi:hypothetical protein
MKDLLIIMCPPHPEYKEAPKDQPNSELRDCPKCKLKMWLSEKKKGAILLSSCIDREIILACYNCIAKIAQADPSLFFEFNKIDL